MPPLEPASILERRLYEQGARNASRRYARTLINHCLVCAELCSADRKEAAATSLLIQPPKIDEIKIVHDIFTKMNDRTIG